MSYTMEDQNVIYDVAIVGAGPAGLTSAIFAHTKNLNSVTIEGLVAGGQLKNLYPHKPVYNYPGFSDIRAGALADYMLNQVKDKNIALKENVSLDNITKDEKDLFKLSSKRNSFKSYAVVLACGMGLLQPNKLGAEGEDELHKNKVFYTISNLDEWKNKEILVIGGGNSAVDNALLLHQNNSKVILVHLLAKFQADDSSVEQIQNKLEGIYLDYKAQHFDLTPDNRVTVTLSSVKSAETKTITVDRVLINIGLKPELSFLDNLDVEKKGKKIVVDTEMQTNMAGIFACGDIVYYPGKVRLISTSIGEAATALNNVAKYLKKHPHLK